MSGAGVPVGTVGRAPALPRVLAPYGLALGAYADVLEPGSAAPGDEVRLL